MKVQVLSLALLFASSAIAVEVDQNDGKTQTRTFVVKTGASAAAVDGAAVVAVETGDGENDVRVMRFVSVDADATPEQVEVRARAHAVHLDPNRGWLGVALGEFETTDGDVIESGITINNVVVGSPAEDAGLQKGDLIVSMDGQTVDSLSDVVTRICEKGPGAVLSITVERDGQTNTTNVTLAAPPEKYDWVEPVEGLKLHDTINFNKMIRISPDGEVEVGSFEDLHEMIPGALVKVLRDSLGDVSVNVDVSVDDGNRKVRINAVRNDETITIEQDNDGPIVVTRNDEVAEYATVADLEAADPDAAELYNHRGGKMAFLKRGDGQDGGQDLSFSFSDDFDWVSEDLGDRIKIELEALHEKLAGAGEEFDVMIHPRHAMVLGHAKAMRTFKVNPDGRIELTIRTGEDEIVQVYRNEADLEVRNPEMYRKYADIQDADAGNE